MSRPEFLADDETSDDKSTQRRPVLEMAKRAAAANKVKQERQHKKQDKSMTEPKLAKEKKTKKVAAAKPRRFDAVVQTPNGTIEKLRVMGLTRSRARLELAAKGLQVIEINEARRWQDIEIGKPVPQAVLLQVTRQLGAFTAAGVPILDALALLAESTKNKRMKATLTAMGEDVRDGDTLPQAARAHPQVFPDFYLAILDASDRSGDLEHTFETLASYLDRDLASNRAVKSALYYPAILVVLAVVAIVVLAVVVLPRFEVFFASLNTELPLPTRMLLAGSRFFGTWWWAIGLVLVMLLTLAWIFRRSSYGRLATDRALLHLWVFGRLLQLIAMERFSRVLGSLSSAGVPLPDSLKLAAGVMGNKAYENAVVATREGVIRGEGLSEPMAATAQFPAEMVQILRVGEQTGRLAQQLEHSAEYYSKEVDYRLKNLTALIEPVVLLVVGGGVGFVAVALVSAMYGIYTSGNLGN